MSIASEQLIRRIDEVKERGLQGKGKNEILQHLEGGKVINKGDAIKAKCYECTGYYADGKDDCQMPMCPLYPYMPYKEGGPHRMERTLTEEQKEASRMRMKDMHIKSKSLL